MLWLIIRINDLVFAPISRTELPTDQGTSLFYVNEVTLGTHLKNRTGCQCSQSMIRGLKRLVLPPDVLQEERGLRLNQWPMANWLSQSWPHNEASIKTPKDSSLSFSLRASKLENQNAFHHDEPQAAQGQNLLELHSGPCLMSLFTGGGSISLVFFTINP